MGEKREIGYILRSADIIGTSTDQFLLAVSNFRFDIIARKKAGTMTPLLTNGGEPVQIAGDP
jgi:hypothetical protein